MAKGLKIFFYILFAFDIIIGIILSLFLNIVIGITTACVLLLINIITFVVILKIEKKKKEIDNISNKIIY
ncbi:hypothetical protein [Candidatus Ruminimicrobiellum ovillum]|uniref:hypothetical protein n=1 Tax=Candidatus Ruminimicrobiellum ovillum TaxID=1947927 RepID=UPI0035597414